jgi:hypothetical protein
MRQRQQMIRQCGVLALVFVFVSVSAIPVQAEAPKRKSASAFRHHLRWRTRQI